MLSKDANPYTGLLSLMQKHGNAGNPTVYAIGQVTGVSPLKVRTGGVELDAEDLCVNADLLAGGKRKLKLTGNICVCGGGEPSADGDDAAGGGNNISGGESGGAVAIGAATDIIGLLKGDGAAISAAAAGLDYALPYRKGVLILTAADWAEGDQTVKINALTDADDITICPAPGSFDVYCACGIRCIAQNGSLLTFACDTAPDTDVTVNFKLETGVAV